MAGEILQTPDLDALALIHYPDGDKVWDFVSSGTPIADLLESTTTIPFGGEPEGLYHKFPVVLSDNPNAMIPINRHQKQAGLASAGKSVTDFVMYESSTHNQAIELEDDVMDHLTGVGAVRDGFTFQMERQTRAARQKFNWILHQDGSGAQGVPSAYDGINTFTVADNTMLPVGFEFTIRGDATGSYWSPTGVGFAAGEAAIVTVQAASGLSITATWLDGTSIAEPAIAMTNFSIFPSDSQGASINGLGIICSASDPTNWGAPPQLYGGMSRATQPLWAATEQSAGGAMLSVQNHLQPMLDALHRRNRGNVPADSRGVKWYVFTGRQNIRVLEAALTAGDRRIRDDLKLVKQDRINGDRMYTAIEYEGAAFIADDSGVANELRFVHGPDCRRWVTRPWFWDNRGGSIWTRQLADDGRGSMFWKASMFTKQQFISRCALRMGRITNTAATL